MEPSLYPHKRAFEIRFGAGHLFLYDGLHPVFVVQVYGNAGLLY